MNEAFAQDEGNSSGGEPSDGEVSVPEVVAESGEINRQNTPQLAPDFVAVHSLVERVEPTLLTDANPTSVRMPLDCAGKTASDPPASALHRVVGSTYEIEAEAGEPVAINTRHGARRTRSERKEDFPRLHRNVPRLPNYFSRAAWGGDDVEDLRFDEEGNDLWGSDPAYYPAQKITVHHSATDNDDPDPAATVRAIYHFHTIEQNFGDIGYNLLIDESGTIYEGRYSGESFIPGHTLTYADGEVALLAVQAAHVGGFNSGNFGIGLLGNFVDREPTAEAVQSLTTILAIMSAIHGLDPLAESTYVNPVNEATADVPNLVAHLDWAATECPGVLRDMLPSIRSEVASALG